MTLAREFTSVTGCPGGVLWHSRRFVEVGEHARRNMKACAGNGLNNAGAFRQEALNSQLLR